MLMITDFVLGTELLLDWLRCQRNGMGLRAASDSGLFQQKSGVCTSYQF